MAKQILFFILGLMVGLSGVGAWGYQHGWWVPPSEAADHNSVKSAAVEGPLVINARGRLAPEGGVVSLAGTAGDRLRELKVKEGKSVVKKDELATFESYVLRSAELAAAKAQFEEAQRHLNAELFYGEKLVTEAKLGVEQLALDDLELEAQQSKYQLLEANLKVAKADLSRLSQLDPSIVSGQEREHQQLVVDRAKSELQSSAKERQKFEAGQKLAKQQAMAKLGTAEAGVERIRQAGQIETLKQNVDLAEARLETSILRAPSDGQVLKILLRPGESVGSTPVLQLGDTSKMIVTAEVYETQVAKLKEGDVATIKSPALPHDLVGTVVRKGVIVSKNKVQSLEPADNADARVVEVRIQLNDEDSKVAKDWIDLQVDAEIRPSKK